MCMKDLGGKRCMGVFAVSDKRLYLPYYPGEGDVLPQDLAQVLDISLSPSIEM